MQEFQSLRDGKQVTNFSGMWSKNDLYQQAVLELLEQNQPVTAEKIAETMKKADTRYRNQANHRQNVALFQAYRIDEKIVNDSDTIFVTENAIKTAIYELQENEIPVNAFKYYHLHGYNLTDTAKLTGLTVSKVRTQLGKCYDFLSKNSSLEDFTDSRFLWGKQNRKRNFPNWEVPQPTEIVDNSECKHLEWNEYFNSLHEETSQAVSLSMPIQYESIDGCPRKDRVIKALGELEFEAFEIEKSIGIEYPEGACCQWFTVGSCSKWFNPLTSEELEKAEIEMAVNADRVKVYKDNYAKGLTQAAYKRAAIANLSSQTL